MRSGTCLVGLSGVHLCRPTQWQGVLSSSSDAVCVECWLTEGHVQVAAAQHHSKLVQGSKWLCVCCWRDWLSVLLAPLLGWCTSGMICAVVVVNYFVLCDKPVSLPEHT